MCVNCRECWCNLTVLFRASVLSGVPLMALRQTEGCSATSMPLTISESLNTQELPEKNNIIPYKGSGTITHIVDLIKQESFGGFWAFLSTYLSWTSLSFGKFSLLTRHVFVYVVEPELLIVYLFHHVLTVAFCCHEDYCMQFIEIKYLCRSWASTQPTDFTLCCQAVCEHHNISHTLITHVTLKSRQTHLLAFLCLWNIDPHTHTHSLGQCTQTVHTNTIHRLLTSLQFHL